MALPLRAVECKLYVYFISLTWRDVCSFWKYCFKSWKQCFRKTQNLPWNYFTQSIDSRFRNSSCQWFKLEYMLWVWEGVERESIVVHMCFRSWSHGRFPPGGSWLPACLVEWAEVDHQSYSSCAQCFHNVAQGSILGESDERTDFSLGA